MTSVSRLRGAGGPTYVAWSLRAALLVCSVAAWVVPGWDLFLRASMSSISLLGLAGAFLTMRIPNHAPERIRGVESVWSAMFVLHFLGHALDLYNTIWYDKFLHAAGGIVAGLAAYWLATSTTWFWSRGDAKPFRVFWVVLSVAVVAGAVVEVFEYASDVIFGVGTQDHPVMTSINDTMTDLVAETVTGFATAAALAWRTRVAQAQAAETRRSTRDGGPRPAQTRRA